MSDELALTPQDFSNLTPDQILQLLDASWPWPLSEVEDWFKDLWNHILQWFHDVVDWVVDKVKPIIDTVWDWIQSAINWITSNVSSIISNVWDWLQSGWEWVISNVGSLLEKAWDWIKSSADWLWSRIDAAFDSVLGWVTTQVSKVWGWITTEVGKVWSWIQSIGNWLWAHIQPVIESIWTTLGSIPGIVAAKIKEVNDWFSNEFIDPFIDWLLVLPKNLWDAFDTLITSIGKRFETWLTASSPGFVEVVRKVLGVASFYFNDFMKWLFANIGGAIAIILTPAVGLVSTLIQGLLPAIGQALVPFGDLIHQFVTPIFEQLFTWAEKLGPVAPGSGFTQKESLTKLIEFTLGGLGAMTLAGESIGFWKHVGMGHVSAMIYDLSNYKMLTAAFVGVLAGVYIRTPLTYYYNKIARPSIPSERDLLNLVGEYAITPERYRETMQYHGYPDDWIQAMHELADRPFSPFLYRILAEAGELDEELLDRELRNASYNEKSLPVLKDAFRRLAAGELKTLMVGVAIRRYREGLDDQDALSQNLLALGVNPVLISKYLFGAELDALTDYQLDLLSYYKDAYHRREMNDTQFLEALDSIPLDPTRSKLIYNREKIKRLKVTATLAPVVKTLTAAQVGALYKLGKLSREDALGRLSTYLPIPSDRALFLELYEPGAPAVPAG